MIKYSEVVLIVVAILKIEVVDAASRGAIQIEVIRTTGSVVDLLISDSVVANSKSVISGYVAG